MSDNVYRLYLYYDEYDPLTKEFISFSDKEAFKIAEKIIKEVPKVFHKAFLYRNGDTSSSYLVAKFEIEQQTTIDSKYYSKET
jgi:hypothetical protein